MMVSRTGVGASSLVRALCLLLCLSACTTALHATRIRNLNLEEMTARADRIVQGRVVNVVLARDPDSGQRVTFVHLRVDRSAKGDARGVIRIKMLGEQDHSVAPRRGIPGLPAFSRGEEVILFLYGDSRSGFTSPVGFGQGKFTVFRDKNGAPRAVNGFGNRNLFDRLSGPAVESIGAETRRLHGGHGLPPDAILEMVETLRRLPAAAER